jgi:ubiquinone/menaquinone biosynthesis C-methylase UbiE
MLRQGVVYAAREKVANIHFSRNRVEALPFADQTFDAAICSGSLHLFPDTAHALHEINRTMKPGLPLAVMTFTPGDKGLFKHAWARNRVQRRGFHLFTFPKLECLLQESGFVDFQPKIFGSVLTFSARKRGTDL